VLETKQHKRDYVKSINHIENWSRYQILNKVIVGIIITVKYINETKKVTRVKSKPYLAMLRSSMGK